MKEEIILIGGGGHCKSCIDVIEKENKFRIAGIVDVKDRIFQKVLSYEIIACDEDLKKLTKKYKNFFLTIGQINNVEKRREKFTFLKSLDVKFPVIISPLAYTSKYSFVDEGTIIMHKAFVNANVKIGKNCIINTNAIIEHDSQIGDNCHISTASVVNGECNIGDGTFIGSNSVIFNNVNIIENTIIGAGSVVVRSIDESGVYVGNPAKKIK
jgi:sugar O-acyltransferase (sialic acid O-acetyltransferase NeuD family)